ncbi:MAG: hypothetical protein ACQETH_03550 [Candidatus Rifleibacteriota bacterium]
MFFTKVPVSAPLFPIAEFSFLTNSFKEKPTNKVYWLAEHNMMSRFLAEFINALDGWPSKIDWILLEPDESPLSLARKSDRNNPPLIVGSDKNYLKIAFFSDANSDYKCHQIVIMLNSRLRGVFPGTNQPWAQETNSMAWVSFIFYQIPFPPTIMSLAIFPINSTRMSLFEDHPLVERFLALKLLRRRADLEIDPYQFDFPELPD